MRYSLYPYVTLLNIILLCTLFTPGNVFSQTPLPENDPAIESETPTAEVYVDQVIDEESLAKEIEAEKRREWGIAPQWAPGNLGVTYRYYHNDTNRLPEISENGVELRWQQETIENGSYDIQIEGLTSDGYDGFQEPDNYRIQLRQNNYIINSKLLLDSDVVHYRSVVPSLVDESYRFRLPSTILQGMGNRLYHNDTTLFLNFGEIGHYEGTAAKAYESDQGSLLGLGAQHRLNRRWDVAFQLWNADDPENMETHQSMAAAVEYQRDLFAQNHQLHILGDSNGKTGLYYDGKIKLGRWQHRTGAQYLPPDLLWTDAPINNDRQGLYWRGERNAYRWFWSLGSEIGQNNLEKDSQIPGYLSTTSFASLAWQYRRRTHFGGNVNVHTDWADSGTATHDIYQYTLRAYADHFFPIGRARIEPQVKIADTYLEQTQRYGLRWNQEYDLFLNHNLNSEIQYYTSDKEEDDLSFKIYFDHSYPWGIKFNGSFQKYYIDYPQLGITQGTSISLGMGWQFFTNWLMSLNADYNTGEIKWEEEEDVKIEGINVLFSISYNIRTGKQRQLYGVNTGDPGRGRIVGRVFLDENRNGKFDLREKALSEIIVYLDGRHSAESGPKGGFEFWPVAAGEHYLTLELRDVPLPWSLADEKPQRIVVPNRGEIEFDFALIRLNE